MGGYARDPDYGKPPRWSRLYARFFPKHTCGSSRHARLIADSLREVRSPVRRLLIDAGYEPDHMASSIEVTVQALWETRARLWKADPVGEQKRVDRMMAKITTPERRR